MAIRIRHLGNGWNKYVVLDSGFWRQVAHKLPKPTRPGAEAHRPTLPYTGKRPPHTTV